MAESKTNRPEPTEHGPAIARRDRDQGTLQHRPGGWFSNPFEFMDRMAEEMDQTFGRLFRGFGSPRGSWLGRNIYRSGEREGLWSPRVEAFQKGDRFIVRADLPGLKKDDVQVEVSEEAVTIHGDRNQERHEEREGYYHTEREYGHFLRTIPLPEGVITESAQASFKDGVLEVSMQAPPAEAARGRRLEIKETSTGSDRK